MPRDYDLAWRWYACPAIILTLILLLTVLCLADTAAAAVSDDEAVACILGEARGEYAKHGYTAFLALADALRNRGTLKGVYGCSAPIPLKEQAFLKRMGYDREALRAWKESASIDLVAGASHWESTDFKTPYWAKGMKVVYQVGKHRFYK